ncbi:MAG: hypothetical protein JHC98_09280 [Thermoleophilaceae bacterium]|nr:hypothetical protein [Thermoleophilaceae bacterium]
MSESSASSPTSDLASNPARLDDLLPLFGGGVALAGVAIIVCALINGFAIAIYGSISGTEDGSTWPMGIVIAAGIFAVVVSVLVGRWILNLRRWIGNKGDPTDLENIRRKRRSFMIGAMCLYLPVTPLLWVAVVAIANTST